MLDIQRIVTGPLEANCYVAAIGGDAIVIDPGEQFELIDAAIAIMEVDVHAILCTHAHPDHLSAAMPVSQKYDAPFHMHEDDAFLLSRVNLFRKLVHGYRPISVPSIDVPIDDGMKFCFGALEATVIHTPGHSPGSVCFEVAGHLFTGDTIARDGLGRSDFVRGNEEDLAASADRLSERFDAGTVLYPGHGDATRLREALRSR